MFSNLSTVLELVTPSLSYEWNARPQSEVRSSLSEQQPFTGLDFSDTPARE